VKSATRSPSTASAGCGRKTVVTTGRSGRTEATAARTPSTSSGVASGGSHMVTTSMSDTSIRYGPIPVTRLSDGRAAEVTSTVRSAATGGRAAPDPSSSTRSGSSARAAATASGTFERNGVPARPEPHLRAPTVATPASAASSR
jgi:hypothetical protein